MISELLRGLNLPEASIDSWVKRKLEAMDIIQSSRVLMLKSPIHVVSQVEAFIAEQLAIDSKHAASIEALK